MTKRPTHAKKSDKTIKQQRVTRKGRQKPATKKVTKKVIKQTPKKGGVKRPQVVRGGRRQSKAKKTVVFPSVLRRQKLRGNIRPKANVKTVRGNTLHKKGVKANTKSQTPLRKGGAKKVGGRRGSNKETRKRKSRLALVENYRKKKSLKAKIQDLQTQLEELDEGLDERRVRKKYKKKHKIKSHITFEHDRNGELKDEKIGGQRLIYVVDLPDGDFEDKVKYVRDGDFDFLNSALTRNHWPNGTVKEPNGIFITLHSEFNQTIPIDEENFRTEKKDLFYGGITEFSRVVRTPDDCKQQAIERMIEWQDNFLERLYEQGETYATGSGEGYNPDNLKSISFKFIY